MYRNGMSECDMLLHDLQRENNGVFRMPDNKDGIWQQIIRDIEEYDELMNHSEFLDKPPDSPLVSSERPDVIYTSNNSEFVMGIECFKIDASKKTKKGSTQIRKEQEADNQISIRYNNNDYIKESDKRFISISEPVEVVFSFSEYCRTLCAVFLEHASRIEIYRENLEKNYRGKKIHLSFYIDDITAIGNYVNDKGKIASLTPMKIPEFIRLLQCFKGLDYVLIKTTSMYVPEVTICSCDMNSLNHLLLTSYTNDTKYISYQYKIEKHFY